MPNNDILRDTVQSRFGAVPYLLSPSQIGSPADSSKFLLSSQSFPIPSEHQSFPLLQNKYLPSRSSDRWMHRYRTLQCT